MLAQWAPENMEPPLPCGHINGEKTLRFQNETLKQWYLDYTETNHLSRYYIHVGFVGKGEIWITSVDGQFNISSQTFWECTPSWSTPETFCYEDFF